MRQGIVLGILVGLIVGATTESLILYSENSSLKVREKYLEGQIASLQQNELEKTLSDKESQIARLKESVAQYQGQLQVLESKIEAIQSSNISVIAVSFSRVEDTSQLLRYWIGRANRSIVVAVYAFTQDALGDALIEAKNKGIDVQILIDNKYINVQGSEFARLENAGISIKSDTRSADMHHKFIIIDGYILGTGSYNWSQAAEDENDENLILLRSQSLADVYLDEFNRLWG
ncbi:MAG: phospholipase D-like domain-containing protein [Candidatus Bathyarchaeia archaeon]